MMGSIFSTLGKVGGAAIGAGMFGGGGDMASSVSNAAGNQAFGKVDNFGVPYDFFPDINNPF